MDTYEKKYKDALERARAKYAMTDQPIHQDLVNIFPELKESEDERIRKSLLGQYKRFNPTDYYDDDITFGDVVSWLEKQGEEIDFANREYWRGYREGKQEILDKYADFEKQSEQKPAVEMKIPEESLGIDSDTYNKIVDECIFGEQKSTVWSKEDELHIRELERLVKQEWATAECENDKDKIHKMSDLSFFLKTLKPQPKQEWSKEDETMLNSFQHKLEVCDLLSTKEIIWIRNKLKSLRPQNTWKPSDEQMEALKETVDEHFDIDGGALWHLYEDLKKLKR